MLPNTCGDLKTRVRVQSYSSENIPGSLEDGGEWIDIGNTSGTDSPRYKRCLWVGVHGYEAFKLALDVSTELATLTFRYDERITTACRIIYNGIIYDIISVDHIRQAKHWTEVKVRGAKGG